MVVRHSTHRAATFVVCLTSIVMLAPTSSEAQQKQPTPAQIAEWQKLSAPGAAHQHLAPLVGRWSFQLSYKGGGNALQTVTGESEFKWVMGGRFLLEESRTTFGGQPFEWIGIHAFDNASGTHTSAWVDNFGTNIERMDGTFDTEANRLTYEEEEDHAGQGKVRTRWAIKLTSANSYTVTITELGAGDKELLAGTITATRAR